MNNKVIQEMLNKTQQKDQEKPGYSNQLYGENSVASSLDKLREQDINAAKEQSELYLKLLKIYIDYVAKLLHEKKRWKQFFIFVTAILFVMPILFFAIIIYNTTTGTWSIKETETICFCIGSFLSFISAVSFLPKFIAEYLFNKNTEDNIVSVVTENQKHDIAIRQSLGEN